MKDHILQLSMQAACLVHPRLQLMSRTPRVLPPRLIGNDGVNSPSRVNFLQLLGCACGRAAIVLPEQFDPGPQVHKARFVLNSGPALDLKGGLLGIVAARC